MIISLPHADSGYKTLGDLQGPLNYTELFGREAPVELEIGAGRGDFIVQYAASRPETNFIAVERKLVVLRKIVTKVKRAQLSNVRILNVEIRHFLREYVRGESLHSVHVYFPDPWPKQRHTNRRLLVHAENLDLIIKSIMTGGLLHFRTDVPDYFTTTAALLDARPELERIVPPAELLAVKTGYEKRFEKHGIPTNVVSYQTVKQGYRGE
ncbi:MAG: tRNA (guanosine(46)-N7)-methyltransferase TrmB [Candidatus Sumerlaeaceae bacterium]